MKQPKWNVWQALLGAVIAIAWWGQVARAEEEVVASEWHATTADSAQVAEQGAAIAAEGSAERAAEEPLLVGGDPLLLDADGTAEEGDDIWDISMRLGFGLALVVLLAWGAAHVLRKSALGKQLGADNSLIRVAERAYLGPKKAVFLVEIGGRALALGVTDDRITPLAEWAAGELDLTPRATSPSPFASQLKNVLSHVPQGGK
jgi:flagellar biosynthetic protein FliO